MFICSVNRSIVEINLSKSLIMFVLKLYCKYRVIEETSLLLII